MFYEWLDFFIKTHDVAHLIQWGGALIVMAIIFAETGLFFGFFLPGDSLLVTAGLFAARGDLRIDVLFFGAAMCAILGDALGFEIGRLSGGRLMKRPDSRFFKRAYLERTQAFYHRHGKRTIVFARFVPVVRTFAPLVAGMVGMPYQHFAIYNILGGILWVGVMLGIGFGLARSIPNIDQYLHFVIVAVIFLSILPAMVEYMRHKNTA
jgi:membrane-associated protein